MSPLLPESLGKASIILRRVGQKEGVGGDGEGKEPGREGSEPGLAWSSSIAQPKDLRAI